MVKEELELLRSQLVEREEVVKKMHIDWENEVQTSRKMEEVREAALEDMGLSTGELLELMNMDKDCPHLV